MDRPTSDGERLAAQSQALRLTLAHLAGRAVRARVDFDDLAQEVFVRALGHPGGLPPNDAELGRFLAHLARHVVVDVARALRAQKRTGDVLAITRSGHGAIGESRIPVRGGGPATAAQQRELSDSLVATYLALAPDHRRVLGLRQFEGLSAEEAAQRMGRSAAAVHSLYRRALEAWGEALDA